MSPRVCALLLAPLVLALIACKTSPPAPSPLDASDSGPLTALASCPQACAVMASFDCTEATPADGVSCLTVCEVNTAILPVVCVAGASTLDALRACGVACLQSVPAGDR